VDVVKAQAQWQIAGIIEKDGFQGSSALGYAVLGTDSEMDQLVRSGTPVLNAIGQLTSPSARQNVYKLAAASGAVFPVVQSPHAYVSPSASLGPGTVTMHGAIVNAQTRVGIQCIINSRALIEHDALIGDFCHISTGALINGAAVIGRGSFIGSGAIVREGVHIGENTVVGAGAIVMSDLPAGFVLKRGLP
jgi:sugar O-acyltransferase (sialic acid O-acetyltransferase NeuD family)